MENRKVISILESRIPLNKENVWETLKSLGFTRILPGPYYTYENGRCPYEPCVFSEENKFIFQIRNARTDKCIEESKIENLWDLRYSFLKYLFKYNKNRLFKEIDKHNKLSEEDKNFAKEYLISLFNKYGDKLPKNLINISVN